MMWVLAGITTILLAQFKWTPLKFDVCMHWRVTDGDDGEVRGERGGELHQLIHTVQWRRASALNDQFISLKASSWVQRASKLTSIGTSSAKELTVQDISTRNSNTLCYQSDRVHVQKSYLRSNTVQMFQPWWEKKCFEVKILYCIPYHSVCRFLMLCLAATV